MKQNLLKPIILHIDSYFSPLSEQTTVDNCSQHQDTEVHDDIMYRRFIFGMIATLSISLLLLVTITIYKHVKLRAHPSSLIASICTVEALLSFQSLIEVPEIGSGYYICYTG